MDSVAIQAVIDDLLKEKNILQSQLDEVTALIGSLERRRQRVSGIQPELQPSVVHSRLPFGTEDSTAPPSVTSGMFAGMTWVAAAKKLLEMHGRPMKTAKILASLEKGGLHINGERPYANLYSAIRRHKDFAGTTEGWRLKAWHEKNQETA